MRLPLPLRAALSALALTAALTGCDDDPPPKPEPKPPVATPEPSEPAPPKDPSDPFDPTSEAVLFELYRAEMSAGEAQLEAWKKYRLVDESGSPNRGRRAAYRAGLEAYAKANPEAWGAFVDELAQSGAR